ncbi:MAG: glycosyltransferase [Candidatus Omnitrophica bacterium]|nr:glycosyltransferase [Candidatus Omnitrophota bacterium]
MNILMMTNTYKPLVGGLEKSVESFTKELRERGHRVMIVAPEYPGMRKEQGVIRIPAIQNFNGSDFSVQLPIPGVLTAALENFTPDLVHSHHPFLIGDTALRVASKYNVPLVFTHHTLYEENVHYIPGDEEAWKRFVIELSSGYANLADLVLVPSESVRKMLKDRNVITPTEVVPTGIYTKRFSRGGRKEFRKRIDIPQEAFVVGHLGRLAPEKNLEFLSKAVAQFLKGEIDAYFLVAGKGPSEELIKEIFRQEGLSDRLRFAGVVQGKDLVDTYHAMDVFAFASQSETQGLVLAEAMAAGIPVVAVDAPGVREVVKDTQNGCLLESEDMSDFILALQWMEGRTASQWKKIKSCCRETAEEFSMKNSIEKVAKVYTSLLIVQGFTRRPAEDSPWATTLRLIQTQWELMKNLTKATGALLIPEEIAVKEETLI